MVSDHYVCVTMNMALVADTALKLQHSLTMCVGRFNYVKCQLHCVG